MTPAEANAATFGPVDELLDDIERRIEELPQVERERHLYEQELKS